MSTELSERTDLSTTVCPSLADGRIDTRGAAGWILRCRAGGRPGLITRDNERTRLLCDVALDELREAIDSVPGVYRMYPGDDAGIREESI